jgi:toxin ParE1/3/4
LRPVRFSAQSRSDLEAIGNFIARENPARAESFVAELRRRCESLGRHSFQGRPMPEIGRGVRCLAYRRYVVIYRPLDDFVAIDRILHSARDWKTLLGGGTLD